MNDLPRQRQWVLVALLTWLAAAPSFSLASDAVPVRIVGNRLLARAIMKGPAGEVPTHLFVDLGVSDALVLHKNAVEMMGIQQIKQIDLTFGSIALKGVPAFAKDDIPEADKITREHSGELEEVPVTGVIGLGAFGDQAVQLNLPDGEIRFGRIDDLPRSDAGTVVELSYEPTTRGLIVPAEVSDGSRARVQFSTSQFESLAEFAAFDKLRIGRDDAASVMIGQIDLLRFGAYRPSGLKGVPRPLPELVLGTDLLSRFRVTIDQSNRKLRFEPVAPPAPRPAEQRYFIADRTGEADAIESFLVENPDTWLKSEAAARLLELRLDLKKGSIEACLKAMELYASSLPADTRAQHMLVIADQVLTDRDGRGLPALRKALDLAGKSAADDLNAAAVHQINARKGMLALREGNMKDARRMLLSAAFGMPGDPRLNLWLGEFYEANRQPARAWSRYVESALSKDAPIEAVRSLERLNQDEAFRQSFSVADAELMLEGRLLSYSPPRVRNPDETASVELVELFTNGTNRNSVGPQLAFDGLLQFFDGAPVVFVSYHLDASMGNALAGARAQLYGLLQPQGVLCDGVVVDMSSGDETAAPKLFDAYLNKTLGAAPKPPISIEASAAWNGQRLDTHVQVKDVPQAKARDLRLYAIIVERCVFALGGNGIGLHYAVARGAMSSPEGFPLDATRDKQDFDLSLEWSAISRTRRAPAATTAGTQPAGKGPPWMRPRDPDPRECAIVLIVQDASTYKVFKSVIIKPAPEASKP